MPAYYKIIETKCEWRACSSRATREVFNTWNAPMGKYCARHAEDEVKHLNHLNRGQLRTAEDT